MSRARNKSELLEFGSVEFQKLNQYVDKFVEFKLLAEPIFDNRTVKDVLAHLHAWHLLMLDWYTVGMRGETPQIPAPGYTFKTAPELNEKLYQDFKDVPWNEMRAKLEKTHNELIDIVKSHTDEELETKKKYKWTGTTSLACYLASAISSHYVWASDLLKKKLKSLGK
jgi:hypothetical protein